VSAVGFIGLGQIGAPMAGHLVDWPEGLFVHDLDANAAAALGERGARVAASTAEVASRAAVISVMVRDDAQVRAVVAEVVPAAAPGTVVAIHSTIRPETAEALGVEALANGVEVVDAPVSGGAIGAHAGTLAVMVGGSESAFERLLEPFGRFATRVVRVGAAGAGTRMKLARNLITFASYAAAGEAQFLAEAAGVDLQALGDVVRHSDQVTGGPGAIMFRTTTAAVGPDDPLRDILVHTRDLGEKDLALAIELGERLGVDLPFARLALERFGPGLGLEQT
jgi:3-hydroxyisobutyrate dehydrogenase-like beta-hydroxyacid dehydrogenase